MSSFAKAIIASTILMTASLTQANQCAYVTKNYAQKTTDVLGKEIDTTTTVASWCEPCGETKADAKKKIGEKIKSVQITHTGYEDFYEIHINGRSVDMAYTYVAGINLAKYVNAAAGTKDEIPGQACQLQGVSDEL